LLRAIKRPEQGGRPVNGGGAPTVSRRQAAKAAGLSKDQQVTATRVARIPRDEFEAAVESDDPPTVTRLLEASPAAAAAARSGPLASRRRLVGAK